MTVPVIRAIETRYKGYRFRSRLEARWAVFFDSLGIEYRYEDEGLRVGGVGYLPDFYLPSKYQDFYIEIKPRLRWELGECKAWTEAHKRLDELARNGKFSLLICGQPWPGEFDLYFFGWPASYPYPSAFMSGGQDAALRTLDLWLGCWGPEFLNEAFSAARGARFEHGESGA